MSRVGGKPDKAASEAVRSAEALFETKPIAEIREIENRTRKDIDKKKREVRDLVGGSYKDLIENSDKIVSIANHVRSIMSNASGIQDGFSSLLNTISAATDRAEDKTDRRTRHQELYAVAGRVKYLVDTPEVLWGALDGKQHLDAARRFLQAQLVHSQLPASFPPDTLSRFPLLRTQWPLVDKFRAQIRSAAQAVLSGEAGASSASQQLGTTDAADCLLAVALLDRLDSQAALATFLAARKSWIEERLKAAAAAGSGGGGGSSGGAASSDGTAAAAAAAAPSCATPADVALLLSDLVNVVQLAIHQVGELFMAPTTAITAAAAGYAASGSTPPTVAGVGGSCLLRSLLTSDPLESTELMFSQRYTDSVGGDASPESAAWRAFVGAAGDKLDALTAGQADNVCMAWMRDVAALFAAHCPQLLAACDSAASLVATESTVKAALQGWQQPPAAATAVSSAAAGDASGGAAASDGPLAKRARGAGAKLPLAAAAASATASASSHLRSWQATCESVLGRVLDVWQEVLAAPFMRRAKQLLDSALEAVGSDLQASLKALMDAAAVAPPEGAGAVGHADHWPMFGLAATTAAATANSAAASSSEPPTPTSPHRRTSKVATAAAGKSAVHGFRAAVDSLVYQFDAELRQVIADALMLTYGSATGSAPGEAGLSRRSSGVVGALLTATPAGKAGGAPLGAREQQSALTAAAVKAAELEPHLQQRCSEVTQALAAALQAQLAALPPAADGLQGAPVVEQALLLARLCSSLATSSRHLQLVMGPTDVWRTSVAVSLPTAASSGPLSRTGSSVSGAPPSSLLPSLTTPQRVFGGRAGGASAALRSLSPKYLALTQRFRSISVLAYQRWARWAAAGLTHALSQALLADESLASSATPLSWAETVIASDAESSALGDTSNDMRFHLPASPSAAASQLLMGACQEVRRVGDHLASAEALQTFEWELGGALLVAMAQLLGTPLPAAVPGASAGAAAGGGTLGRRLSEKGVLQLLMDVRTVRDALAGGRPLAATSGDAAAAAAAVAATTASAPAAQQDPSQAAALAERKRVFASLEASLSERLDPIDWATYEPCLWANVARHYQRVCVLFGMVAQLQRSHPEAAPKAASAAGDSNPLGVLPLLPRFQYLPISAPATSALAAAAAASRAAKAALAAGGLKGGATGSASAAAGVLGGGGGIAGAAGGQGQHAAGGGCCDLAGDYSFADIGRRARGGGSGGGSGAPGAGGSAAAGGWGDAADGGGGGGSAFSSLQARLQAGSMSLGSFILGESRAADLTAMAQQGISGFLPTGATGMLSSLAKGVVRK